MGLQPLPIGGKDLVEISQFEVALANQVHLAALKQLALGSQFLHFLVKLTVIYVGPAHFLHLFQEKRAFLVRH